MAVSSTSSGSLKTGVCLSTDRPDNPYNGQVIYETDTNRVLVYDNSAWVVVANAASTGFPSSLDTNTVDSIAALQAKVGADSSAVTTSLDYKVAQLEAQTGRLLQVVTATYSTEEANTSTTFVATSLEASITPSSTDSKILVFASVPYRSERPSSVYSGEARFAIYRDNTTSLYESYTQKFYDSATSNKDFLGNKEMIWLDSPSTTSSTTYTVYARGTTGQSLQVFDAGSVGYLTLVEFG